MSLGLLREFLETARFRGVRWAGRALFRRCVFSYRQAFLFRGRLMGSDEPVLDTPLECRLATRDDLDRLRVFEPYVVRSRMRRWLESEGTWVLLALDGDRPVAFECLSTTPNPDPLLPPMALTKTQAWLNEMYVAPEYRRRHVSLGLRRYRHRVMRTWGFEEVLSKIDGDNYVSLKRMLSVVVGRSVGIRRITCLCVLGLRWWWLDQDGRPLLEAHLRRHERGDGRARHDPDQVGPGAL